MRKETNKVDIQQINVKIADKPQEYNQFGFFKVEFDPEYDAANGTQWDDEQKEKQNDLH